MSRIKKRTSRETNAMSSGVCVGDAFGLHETEDAVLVDFYGEEVWIPKSQIHDDSECYDADTAGALVVTEWFAKKQGWESS